MSDPPAGATCSALAEGGREELNVIENASLRADLECARSRRR